MQNDMISDFLARIKNAYMARHKTVVAPYAKILVAIGKILEKEKFIAETKVISDGEKKKISLTLVYPGRKPALTDIIRVSKPGLRVYVGRNKIPLVYGGLGVVILSTPQGIMSGKEARKKNLGGEVVCKIW